MTESHSMESQKQLLKIISSSFIAENIVLKHRDKFSPRTP